MTRRSLALAGVLSGVAAVSWASVTLTPTAHDFGQVIIGVSASTRFKFTGAPTPKPSPPPTVSIAGPDAAEFVVDSGANKTATGPFFQQSTCVAPTYWVHWNQGNPCDYLVHFQPHSLGVKTARMVVVYNGETAAATLKGEGVFGCRAYLVSCNYADNYSGSITIKTVDSTTSGALGRKVRFDTNVQINILYGVASCSGVQTDFEEEYDVTVLRTRSSTKGVISGAGLFAVEFRKTGGSFEYELHFDCPTASQTITSIDYIAGTTTTGQVAATPAEWRHASLVADPQPATQVGMVHLVGNQLDINAGSGVNDEAGYSRMVWSLKRN